MAELGCYVGARNNQVDHICQKPPKKIAIDPNLIGDDAPSIMSYSVVYCLNVKTNWRHFLLKLIILIEI